MLCARPASRPEGQKPQHPPVGDARPMASCAIPSRATISAPAAITSASDSGCPPPLPERGPKPRAAPAGETRAEASAARREAFIRAQIAAIVAGLVPIRSTDGDRYLRDERGIDIDAIADVLERTDAVGWHPKVYFNEPERHGRPRHPLHGQLLGCIIGDHDRPCDRAADRGDLTDLPPRRQEGRQGEVPRPRRRRRAHQPRRRSHPRSASRRGP